MIRVRAKKDGTYAGHYWEGPIETEQGTKPGDVFDVEEKPFEARDERGNVVFEPVLINGVPKMEKGQPVLKPKMVSFFSPVWMERVPDDTELTYPDRDPVTIPPPYRLKKAKQGPVVPLPAELAAMNESPL